MIFAVLVLRLCCRRPYNVLYTVKFFINTQKRAKQNSIIRQSPGQNVVIKALIWDATWKQSVTSTRWRYGMQTDTREAGNAWSPMVEWCIGAMTSVDVDADLRRRRESMSATLWSLAVRYLGAIECRQRYVSTASLNSIRCECDTRSQCTLCLKKVPTFKLSITLSNLNRFWEFLHCRKANEICYKTVQHHPPHLRHVATLPWEIENSNFLLSSRMSLLLEFVDKVLWVIITCQSNCVIVMWDT